MFEPGEDICAASLTLRLDVHYSMSAMKGGAYCPVAPVPQPTFKDMCPVKGFPLASDNGSYSHSSLDKQSIRIDPWYNRWVRLVFPSRFPVGTKSFRELAVQNAFPESIQSFLIPQSPNFYHRRDVAPAASLLSGRALPATKTGRAGHSRTLL